MKKVFIQCILVGCTLFWVVGCGKKDVTLEQYFDGNLSLKELVDPVEKSDLNITCRMDFLGQEGLVDFRIENGEIIKLTNYATLFDENSKYKKGSDFKEVFADYLENLYGEEGNSSLEAKEEVLSTDTTI